MPIARPPHPAVSRSAVIGALLALYLIWGAAYYVIRVGVGYWPPLLLAGLRSALAGAVLLGWSRWRGTPLPSLRETANAALLGLLLIAIGSGCINLAETHVSSGATALILATDPLFIAVCARLFGVRTDWRQWLAILMGFAGIMVLNQGANLSASPLAAALLIGANLAWALGSVLSQRLRQASGMMASAIMLLIGGIELLIYSVASGERMANLPPPAGWLTLLYLALFASVIGFTAYLFLLKHVSTALATSYAYVNPVVAALLGIWLLDEKLSPVEWLGMSIILASVILIVWRPSARDTDIEARQRQDEDSAH